MAVKTPVRSPLKDPYDDDDFERLDSDPNELTNINLNDFNANVEPLRPKVEEIESDKSSSQGIL